MLLYILVTGSVIKEDFNIHALQLDILEIACDPYLKHR